MTETTQDEKTGWLHGLVETAKKDIVDGKIADIPTEVGGN